MGHALATSKEYRFSLFENKRYSLNLFKGLRIHCLLLNSNTHRFLRDIMKQQCFRNLKNVSVVQKQRVIFLTYDDIWRSGCITQKREASFKIGYSQFYFAIAKEGTRQCLKQAVICEAIINILKSDFVYFYRCYEEKQRKLSQSSGD